MSFPWTKGWQLSSDKDPAVVARTCPLVKKLVKSLLNTMHEAYNTRGDLIFSARRVKLTLFHAWVHVITMRNKAGIPFRTGVMDVKMHGWLPNSSSYTESYHPV